MEEYYEGLGKFSSHTRFEMGDGSKVRFWHYMWCEDITLKEAYNLYACIWYCMHKGCFYCHSLGAL